MIYIDIVFEGVVVSQSCQELVGTNTFTIKAPSFIEAEQYDFIWDVLKTVPAPVQIYPF